MTGTFVVGISRSAEADMASIATYLMDVRGPEDASAFLDAVLDRISTLAEFPLRGSVPREVEPVDDTEYRQILFGRYRIIYEVDGQQVTIVLIADGRRDMLALLRDRLLNRHTA